MESGDAYAYMISCGGAQCPSEEKQVVVLCVWRAIHGSCCGVVVCCANSKIASYQLNLSIKSTKRFRAGALLDGRVQSDMQAR